MADPDPIATVPAAVSCCAPRWRTKFSNATESVGILRDRFLAGRQCPLRLADSQIQCAQVELVMVGMKQDISTEAKRAPILLEHRVELELILLVRRLSGHA